VSGEVRQAVARKASSRRPVRQPAAELPVARVAVDISLPHLDRPFDYLVPDSMAESAAQGCQVRVRFAGQLTGGFLLERRAGTDHQGKLGFLERVVSPEPVLTPEIAGLARAVADRYGGTLADVLRLAIPPRHAAASRSGAGGSGTNRDDLVTAADAAATAGAGTTGQAADGAAGSGAAGGAVGGVPGLAGGLRAADTDMADLVADGEAGDPAASVHAGEPWRRYPDGPSFLAALAGGRSPRAIWSALPGGDWPAEIAQAVAAVTESGRGAVVVVPDSRDLALVDCALSATLGPGRHVVLMASLGPAERYRRWLAAARGEVRVVAGTRSAMFAPVAGLGLVVLWDEGDDLHAEPRSPYPHAREVLALRAHRARCAALIGGYARTAEAAQLISSGWARPLQASRAVVRQFAPAVQPAGAEAELARDEAARSARLPGIALRTARAALAGGPVLFQVPRRGYLAAVACERCHFPARCDCGGPAELPGPQAPLRCGWCGSAIGRSCRRCGHQGLRALVTGARRTAEELGRAFAGFPVLSSGGSQVLDRVGSDPAVVVATPGAEPVALGGYAGAVLLDGWAMLGLASLRAAEEALRRWMNAAALVRPAADGGSVVVVADGAQPAVQALIRWDPATHADRELAERAELRFPPASRMAALSGPEPAVAALLKVLELPPSAELLGPLPAAGDRAGPAGGRAAAAGPGGAAIRYLVRVRRSEGTALALALRAAEAVRSAAKEPGAVRVQLDPAALI
jgi:primosomal protein N' (replication factor Y) (superfamily II helicase)